jgi:hypothetical protein
MTLLRRIAGFGIGIGVVIGAAAAIVSPPDADASVVYRASPAGSTARAEVARIHAHFDSVLVELGQRDVSMLSASQREARSSLTRTLQAYRDRSVFPNNYDFAAPTPYFIDRKTGTLCAVAHLLESTGRRDIVDRVARANNNVWVAELAGDAELAAWLDAHGLTLVEAARIQVPYMSPAQQAQQTTFMVAAPLSLAVATSTGVWNAWGNSQGQRRVGNILGVTSGVLAAALSSTAMLQPDANPTLRATAGAGVAIGTVTALLSTRAMMRRGSYLAAKRDAERADPAIRRAPVETSIAPIIPVGRNGGTGVSVSLRF